MELLRNQRRKTRARYPADGVMGGQVDTLLGLSVLFHNFLNHIFDNFSDSLFHGLLDRFLDFFSVEIDLSLFSHDLSHGILQDRCNGWQVFRNGLDHLLGRPAGGRPCRLGRRCRPLRQRPVALERLDQAAHDFVIAENDAHFAPGVQLNLTQALTADERQPAVADHGARMEPQPRKLRHLELFAWASHSAHHFNFGAGSCPILQEEQHCRIADLGVVNQQLLAGATNKGGELPAGVDRTDHKVTPSGIVRPARRIRLEQLDRFLHEPAVSSDDPEAAATFDVLIGKVEGHQIKFAAVDDHQFVVIAQQIAARTRHSGSIFEQAGLQLAKIGLTAAVGVGDQSVDENATTHGILQGALDLRPIEAEDHDLDAFFGVVDPFDQRQHTVAGLNDQLQDSSLLESRRASQSLTLTPFGEANQSRLVDRFPSSWSTVRQDGNPWHHDCLQYGGTFSRGAEQEA